MATLALEEMSMVKMIQVNKVDPLVFLADAQAFYRAAAKVYGEEHILNRPLYFLYFHTMELAFKAYLRSHSVPTSALQTGWGHDLLKLYEDCRDRGFVIGSEDRFDVRNVVVLLTHVNDRQGLRYYNPIVSTYPSMSWTRDVVQKVFLTVAAHLGVPTDPPPGPPVRFAFTLSKPGKQ